jgi:hypothetical protein
MSSRALSLAAVMFLIGCLAAASAQAENLDAGKSPSQIFAGTCSECHKSSRGLLRKVPAASLPGFLRQHYTTSGQMAAVLSAYLIANGAADRRPLPPDAQPKPGTDAKADETKPADQADRRGRRRPLRPGEAPDTAKTDAAKTDTSKTDTSKPDTSKTDTAKTDAAKTDAAKDEPSKGEPVKDVKPSSETAKGEDSKPEGTKPSGEGRSEAAKEAVKIDAPKATGEAPALRADPVPPVTPAPATAPAPPAAASVAPERAPEPPAPAAPSEPPSVTASAPPPAPAGPPAPPISQ